jgi:ankyrin repeat protein
MAKLLLAHGADINLVGGKYGTPLQDAATRGRVGLLELLIDKGADVNVEGGKYGLRCKLLALQYFFKIKDCNELLARGAKVNTSCG